MAGEKIRVRLIDGRPTLEVRADVSGLKGDNVEVLRRLAESVPELMEPATQRRLISETRSLDPAAGGTMEDELRIQHASKSLGALFKLASGTAKPREVRVGSSINVSILDDQGNRLLTAEPGPFEAVEELRRQVGRTAEEIRSSAESSKLAGDPDEIVGKMRQGLEDYGKAFRYGRLHVPDTQIPKAAGLSVTRGAVAKWLAGTGIPMEIGTRTVMETGRKGFEVTVPMTESVDFAYMLGGFASQVSFGSTPNVIIFHHENAGVVDRMERGLKCLTTAELKKGVRTKSTGRGEEHYVACYSVKPLRYLNQVTDNNRRVPFEHVVTEDERRAYVDGFTASKIKVDTRSIKIGKLHSGPLLEDIALLLKRSFQMRPFVSHARAPYISLNDTADLRAFARTFEAPNPPVKERLEKLASVEKLEDVREKGYLKRRAEQLERIERERPDPDIIGRYFRKGLSSEEARERAMTEKNPVEETAGVESSVEELLRRHGSYASIPISSLHKIGHTRIPVKRRGQQTGWKIVPLKEGEPAPKPERRRRRRPRKKTERPPVETAAEPAVEQPPAETAVEPVVELPAEPPPAETAAEPIAEPPTEQPPAEAVEAGAEKPKAARPKGKKDPIVEVGELTSAEEFDEAITLFGNRFGNNLKEILKAAGFQQTGELKSLLHTSRSERKIGDILDESTYREKNRIRAMVPRAIAFAHTQPPETLNKVADHLELRLAGFTEGRVTFIDNPRIALYCILAEYLAGHGELARGDSQLAGKFSNVASEYGELPKMLDASEAVKADYIERRERYKAIVRGIKPKEG